MEFLLLKRSLIFRRAIIIEIMYYIGSNFQLTCKLWKPKLSKTRRIYTFCTFEVTSFRSVFFLQFGLV